MKRLIAFDVDSTLLRVESLDTAIEHALSGRDDAAEISEQLHTLTQAGMTGRMELRDSLTRRLAIIPLDRGDIGQVSERLRRQITPGMKPILRQLREQGDECHAISGGFTDLLEPVLEDLGFDRAEIHANTMLFDGQTVVGLDLDNPLSRNGGKADILNRIGARADQTIMVGDGMTDFEAYEQGAADRFIGFGVIAQREVVLAAAEHSGAEYVRSMDALMTALRR